jgi:S-DNA-T family DNA segregation ATPase FtsK/SpoIIIE
LTLLNDPPEENEEIDKEVYLSNARLLEKKLLDFGVAGNVVEICPGPVITMYEFSPAPGIKINKVASLADDLALALRTHSVRIVAPIPGKAVIGIELANTTRHIVYLKEILASSIFNRNREKLLLTLGQDIMGEPVLTDLTKMPHLLIAGATGTGKSVGLNAMICSLLYGHHPDRLRFLMIDPKRIELSLYDGIPHLLHPVVSEPKEATRALRWAVMEMERRYQILEVAQARNLQGYNKTAEEPLPYLVVIIDELADLMIVSSKEVESAIIRLAQMARAAGIHLIVATQRPSVDVITGLIKANFPARISFKVSSKVDSRTILDIMGAERLLGMGDMLFLPPGSSALERIHGAYVSEKEIFRVVEFLKAQGEPDYDQTVIEPIPGEEDSETSGPGGESVDDKYDEAVEMVTQTGQASISMLQRRLRVGYNRAARMIEQMEHDGVVSPTDNMGRRHVLVRKYE